MPTEPHRRRIGNIATGVILGVLSAVLVVVVIAALNPWPSAMLIRSLFEKGARDTIAEMEPFVPTSGVSAQRDISYGDAGADTSLDVFSPTGTTTALPTVVWI